MAHRFDATPKSFVAEHPADFAAVFGLPTDEPATPLNVDLSTLSAATRCRARLRRSDPTGRRSQFSVGS